MKLAFFGSPPPSAVVLEALLAAGHEVACVVTAPDRRRGRGGATSPTAVGEVAMRHGLVITHEVGDVMTCDADLGVVVAFGQIIPARVLDAVPMVNIHYSLLPRWRGAAPVERAILAGDDVTGVCVMEVVPELDAGAVYAHAEVPIGSKSASALMAELTDVGVNLLVEGLAAGWGVPEPQVGEVTYAHKITPDDRHIDWSTSAEMIDRVVRIGSAWTTWRGERVVIVGGDVTWTGFVPTIVRPAGRGDMAADDFWRGARPDPGEWFV